MRTTPTMQRACGRQRDTRRCAAMRGDTRATIGRRVAILLNARIVGKVTPLAVEWFPHRRTLWRGV
jgi:hypothetical protein